MEQSKMPYRRAWIWCIAILAVTFIAFWPGYFSQLGEAKASSHFHAVTATLWILLVAAQSWSIGSNRRKLHASMGLAIFVLVPLFVLGGAGAIKSMAVATGSGQDPFYNVWGASLGIYDLVASLGFLALAAMALKDRRRVSRHAAWLLATPLLLIGPILSRLYPRYIPGLSIQGPEDFGLFRWGIHLGGLTAIAVAVWLWSRHRRDGAPWLVVAAINLAQMLLFETLGFFSTWKALFVAIGSAPVLAFALTSVTISITALWWGWRSVPPRRTGRVEAES